MKRIFMIMSLCALVFAGCNSKKEEEKEEKTKFVVTTPIERDTTITKITYRRYIQSNISR